MEVLFSRASFFVIPLLTSGVASNPSFLSESAKSWENP